MKISVFTVCMPEFTPEETVPILREWGADGFRVTVRQIAGLIARRIVGWADEGTQLAKGERFGMIRFGSRVELYLPPGADVVAEVGEYAKGGETILARRN